MIEIEYLEKLAAKLMFEMKESEYETLQQEFDVILKQMDLIGEIENISSVKPMTFPYITYEVKPRRDEIKDTLETEDVLSNAKETDKDQVRVPKVVK